MSVEFRKIEREELIGQFFKPLKDLLIRDRAETEPGSKSLDDEDVRKILDRTDHDRCRYFACDNNMFLGIATISKPNDKTIIFDGDNNKARFYGFVLPEHRRQGICSKLARHALSDPFCFGTEEIESHTNITDSGKFLEFLGGRLFSSSSTRFLDVSSVDWNLVDSWSNQAFGQPGMPAWEYIQEINPSFVHETIDLSLEINKDLGAMVNDDSEWTKEKETEKQLKFIDHCKAKGMSYECILLKGTDGSVLGYISTAYDPLMPHEIWHVMTAVWKRLRGRGYGKLLKALMLKSIKGNHPYVEKIWTSNNDLNAPMLGINNRLGFVVHHQYKSYVFWKSKALEALNAKVVE